MADERVSGTNGGPRIAVTLSNPERARDPAVAAYKNGRYLAALERHGAHPIALDERTAQRERERALASAHGLLITGGADVDPARYGEAGRGSGPTDPGRDALDEAAFRTADRRGIPVLGVCRGLQAINVFSGGSLVQHVDHHESPPYPERSAEATRHRLRLVPGSRLRALIGVEALEVNSFHHQAVDPPRLAPGLRVAGTAGHESGELVEALEATDGSRWLFAVQCHPERDESSPAELEALWAAFVAACRETAGRRG